jgi:hypothetical protein
MYIYIICDISYHWTLYADVTICKISGSAIAAYVIHVLVDGGKNLIVCGMKYLYKSGYGKGRKQNVDTPILFSTQTRI